MSQTYQGYSLAGRLAELARMRSGTVPLVLTSPPPAAAISPATSASHEPAGVPKPSAPAPAELPATVASAVAPQGAVEAIRTYSGPGSSLTSGVQTWMDLMNNRPLQNAVSVVREVLADPKQLSKEEKDRRLQVLAEAQAGDVQAEAELKAQIAKVLETRRLFVPGATSNQVVDAVFESCWGLDVLAPIYRDPNVEEIRVNNYDRIYTVRLGRPYLEPLAFPDNIHMLRIIRRILLHDRIDITRDAPRVETTRRDGCRVTATVPPFTRYPSMVIRKFTSMEISADAFLRYQSFNERMLGMLKVLAKGRASILLSGATGTGKTTMLRLLVSFLPPSLRILTLETDLELNLLHYFPDRDVIEMEAHPELQPPLTLQEAFKTILRMTPDVIIMGEARSGEADEMVKAAMRGHDGSMGTVHVSSTREIIPAVCNMILEEKPNRPLPVLRQQVASAFQVLIQLVRWPSGRKMVEEITECSWDYETNEIVYNTLVKWDWQGDDPEQGYWIFPNQPTDRLINKLRRGGVTMAELKEAGLV